jgi:hypothetical protein
MIERLEQLTACACNADVFAFKWKAAFMGVKAMRIPYGLQITPETIARLY